MKSETTSLGFIGAGQMAEAIMSSVITAGSQPSHIAAVDVNPERLTVLSQRLGIATTTDLGQLVDRAEVCLLAVKPGQIPEVCADLNRLQQNWSTKSLVTIAAGIGVASVESAFDHPVAVVRAMPGLTMEVGLGCTALFAGRHCTAKDRQRVENIFQTGSQIWWLDNENDMHGFTAVSGSGPGFVFYLLEQMVQAAIELGFDADQARSMVVESARGATVMASLSDDSLKQLCARVTSSGGTTAKGLEQLAAADLRAVFERVYRSAQRRCQQLSDVEGSASSPASHQR